MTCLTYFEPLTAGHCAFWARMTLSGAARDPRISRLRLVTGEKMVARLEDVISETGLELEILPPDEIAQLEAPKLLDRGRAQWARARAALAGEGGQLFMPFMDHAIYGALLDRRPVNGQVSGIIFRPPNSHNLPFDLRRRVDEARRWGTYLAARRPALNRLFTLDECAAAAGMSSRFGLLDYLPDPHPDLSLLAATRKSPPRKDGRTCLLLFGALTERKGILAILDALQHLSPTVRAGLALRFVGRVDAADRAAFQERLATTRAACPDIVIELHDDFVPEATLAQEVIDCDVVLAPYQNHMGSSGVVYWAAAAGKPLITQRTGLMGYQVEAYDLGLATDTCDPKALAEALTQAPTRPRNTAFLAEHSPGAFVSTILDGCLAARDRSSRPTPQTRSESR